jgi:hypothetical protein
MMFGDEEEPGEVAGTPQTLADRPRSAVAAHTGHEGKANHPAIFHPPAYRGVVAGWPQGWRERWGRRANELEEAGLSWRDAEAQAFVEVWNQVRQERRPEAAAPSDPDPERN